MMDGKRWMGLGVLVMLLCGSAWASPIWQPAQKEPEIILKSTHDDSNLQSCLWVLRWQLERIERVNEGYPDPAIKYDSNTGILWGDRPMLAPTPLQRLFD